MRPLPLRSIVAVTLFGLALMASASTRANAAELPANATLQLPDRERPLVGWSTMVVVTSASEQANASELDVRAIADMSVQKGAAAITLTIPEGAGTEVCNASVRAVLDFLHEDPHFDPMRVVFAGYGQCAREILVMGNRYPERIRGLLAISPRGGVALPTMWGGFRAPQSLYVMAANATPAVELGLVNNAAEQWREAGGRVVVRKHPGTVTDAAVWRTELTLALDWLLMTDGC